MTPVLQTIFTLPGGNCFQACVASILEVPLDEVPHFLKDSDGGPWKQEHWDAVKEFAWRHGRSAVWLDPDLPEDIQGIEPMNAEGHFSIATGKSPCSDLGHCVVWQQGKLFHDPIGDMRGLASEPWLYIFFPTRTNSVGTDVESLRF